MRAWLIVVAGVFGAFPAPAAQPAGRPASSVSPQQEGVRRAFEEGLRGSVGGAFFLAIERHFPADYRLMVDDMFSEAMADPTNRARHEQMGFEAARRFLQLRMGDLMNAPAPMLVEINRRQLEIARSLAPGHPRLCAQYVMTGFQPGVIVPPEAMAHVQALSVKLIEAAAAGRSAPRVAGRGQIREEDAVAWIGEVERLDPKEEVTPLIADEAALAAAAPDRQCAVGIAIHSAVAALPEATAANVAAFLIAEGARAQ